MPASSSEPSFPAEPTTTHHQQKTNVEPPKYQYKASIVSYLDILGMRQLLQDAGKDADSIGTILRVLRSLSTPNGHDTSVWEWRFSNFSDLTLRSVPIFSDENLKFPVGILFHELSELASIQVNLLAKGVLIRGAVTVGYIFMEARFLASHKELIETSVTKTEALEGQAREKANRLGKLRWLTRYHNQHIDGVRPQFLKQEVGVSRQSLYVGETRARK